MPGGDRTGPLGQGPRTGRAAGYCAGYGVPGSLNPSPVGYRGYGRGRGGGGGRGGRRGGWGRGSRAPTLRPGLRDVPLPSREKELSMLQNDLRCLEQSAERLRRRIDELNAQESNH